MVVETRINFKDRLENLKSSHPKVEIEYKITPLTKKRFRKQRDKYVYTISGKRKAVLAACRSLLSVVAAVEMVYGENSITSRLLSE
jgi:hypothetical protein